MKKMRVVLFYCVLLCLCQFPVFANEKMIHSSQDVFVYSDRLATITETTTVQSEPKHLWRYISSALYNSSLNQTEKVYYLDVEKLTSEMFVGNVIDMTRSLIGLITSSPKLAKFSPMLVPFDNMLGKLEIKPGVSGEYTFIAKYIAKPEAAHSIEKHNNVASLAFELGIILLGLMLVFILCRYVLFACIESFVKNLVGMLSVSRMHKKHEDMMLVVLLWVGIFEWIFFLLRPDLFILATRFSILTAMPFFLFAIFIFIPLFVRLLIIVPVIIVLYWLSFFMPMLEIGVVIFIFLVAHGLNYFFKRRVTSA